MVTANENELLTLSGPGTPMGEVLRRYWIPALISWELAEPDGPPVRVKLLGEELVAFRDTNGRLIGWCQPVTTISPFMAGCSVQVKE